jgi:putative DNA primase/helicase
MGQAAEEERVSSFLDFARSFGILIDEFPPVGRWLRLPTVDHPRSRNGAVKWMGDHGFVQNHATQTDVAIWKAEGNATAVDRLDLTRIAKVARNSIAAAQRRAAEKAEWILGQCEQMPHRYLANKGFPQAVANVWMTDTGSLVVIPMRVRGTIVGCQLIDKRGEKRFLAGQRTNDAVFVFHNHGPAVLCEGYATGLSCQAALRALRARYTLIVCFSAQNLKRIAATLPKGLVVADNDASGTGERVAKETGWPYFLPPEVGQDFNDFHQSTSLFTCSQALRGALLER